jgi:hypothetical protein
MAAAICKSEAREMNGIEGRPKRSAYSFRLSVRYSVRNGAHN